MFLLNDDWRLKHDTSWEQACMNIRIPNKDDDSIVSVRPSQLWLQVKWCQENRKIDTKTKNAPKPRFMLHEETSRFPCQNLFQFLLDRD